MPTVTVEDGTGVVGANSLIDAAYADAFWDCQLNGSQWTALDADTKARAILMAMRKLDCYDWCGERMFDATSWPRSGFGVPEKIKEAQAMLAMQLYQSGGQSTAAGGDPVVSSISVPGGPSMTFKNGAVLSGDACTGGLSEAGSTASVATDLDCLIAPYLKPKMPFNRLKICR